LQQVPEEVQPIFDFASTRSTSRGRAPTEQSSPGVEWPSVAEIWCQLPTSTRRFHHMHRTAIALGILEAA